MNRKVPLALLAIVVVVVVVGSLFLALRPANDPPAKGAQPGQATEVGGPVGHADAGPTTSASPAALGTQVPGAFRGLTRLVLATDPGGAAPRGCPGEVVRAVELEVVRAGGDVAALSSALRILFRNALTQGDAIDRVLGPLEAAGYLDLLAEVTRRGAQTGAEPGKLDPTLVGLREYAAATRRKLLEAVAPESADLDEEVRWTQVGVTRRLGRTLRSMHATWRATPYGSALHALEVVSEQPGEPAAISFALLDESELRFVDALAAGLAGALGGRRPDLTRTTLALVVAGARAAWPGPGELPWRAVRPVGPLERAFPPGPDDLEWLVGALALVPGQAAKLGGGWRLRLPPQDDWRWLVHEGAPPTLVFQGEVCLALDDQRELWTGLPSGPRAFAIVEGALRPSSGLTPASLVAVSPRAEALLRRLLEEVLVVELPSDRRIGPAGFVTDTAGRLALRLVLPERLGGGAHVVVDVRPDGHEVRTDGTLLEDAIADEDTRDTWQPPDLRSPVASSDGTFTLDVRRGRGRLVSVDGAGARRALAAAASVKLNVRTRLPGLRAIDARQGDGRIVADVALTGSENAALPPVGAWVERSLADPKLLARGERMLAVSAIDSYAGGGLLLGPVSFDPEGALRSTVIGPSRPFDARVTWKGVALTGAFRARVRLVEVGSIVELAAETGDVLRRNLWLQVSPARLMRVLAKDGERPELPSEDQAYLDLPAMFADLGQAVPARLPQASNLAPLARPAGKRWLGLVLDGVTRAVDERALARLLVPRPVEHRPGTDVFLREEPGRRRWLELRGPRRAVVLTDVSPDPRSLNAPVVLTARSGSSDLGRLDPELLGLGPEHALRLPGARLIGTVSISATTTATWTWTSLELPLLGRVVTSTLPARAVVSDRLDGIEAGIAAVLSGATFSRAFGGVDATLRRADGAWTWELRPPGLGSWSFPASSESAAICASPGRPPIEATLAAVGPSGSLLGARTWTLAVLRDGPMDRFVALPRGRPARVLERSATGWRSRVDRSDQDEPSDPAPPASALPPPGRTPGRAALVVVDRETATGRETRLLLEVSPTERRDVGGFDSDGVLVPTSATQGAVEEWSGSRLPPASQLSLARDGDGRVASVELLLEAHVWGRRELVKIVCPVTAPKAAVARLEPASLVLLAKAVEESFSRRRWQLDGLELAGDRFRFDTELLAVAFDGELALSSSRGLPVQRLILTPAGEVSAEVATLGDDARRYVRTLARAVIRETLPKASLDVPDVQVPAWDAEGRPNLELLWSPGEYGVHVRTLQVDATADRPALTARDAAFSNRRFFLPLGPHATSTSATERWLPGGARVRLTPTGPVLEGGVGATFEEVFGIRIPVLDELVRVTGLRLEGQRLLVDLSPLEGLEALKALPQLPGLDPFDPDHAALLKALCAGFKDKPLSLGPIGLLVRDVAIDLASRTTTLQVALQDPFEGLLTLRFGTDGLQNPGEVVATLAPSCARLVSSRLGLSRDVGVSIEGLELVLHRGHPVGVRFEPVVKGLRLGPGEAHDVSLGKLTLGAGENALPDWMALRGRLASVLDRRLGGRMIELAPGVRWRVDRFSCDDAGLTALGTLLMGDDEQPLDVRVGRGSPFSGDQLKRLLERAPARAIHAWLGPILRGLEGRRFQLAGTDAVLEVTPRGLDGVDLALSSTRSPSAVLELQVRNTTFGWRVNRLRFVPGLEDLLDQPGLDAALATELGKRVGAVPPTEAHDGVTLARWLHGRAPEALAWLGAKADPQLRLHAALRDALEAVRPRREIVLELRQLGRLDAAVTATQRALAELDPATRTLLAAVLARPSGVELLALARARALAAPADAEVRAGVDAALCRLLGTIDLPQERVAELERLVANPTIAEALKSLPPELTGALADLVACRTHLERLRSTLQGRRIDLGDATAITWLDDRTLRVESRVAGVPLEAELHLEGGPCWWSVEARGGVAEAWKEGARRALEELGDTILGRLDQELRALLRAGGPVDVLKGRVAELDLPLRVDDAEREQGGVWLDVTLLGPAEASGALVHARLHCKLADGRLVVVADQLCASDGLRTRLRGLAQGEVVKFVPEESSLRFEAGSVRGRLVALITVPPGLEVRAVVELPSASTRLEAAPEELAARLGRGILERLKREASTLEARLAAKLAGLPLQVFVDEWRVDGDGAQVDLRLQRRGRPVAVRVRDLRVRVDLLALRDPAGIRDALERAEIDWRAAKVDATGLRPVLEELVSARLGEAVSGVTVEPTAEGTKIAATFTVKRGKVAVPVVVTWQLDAGTVDVRLDVGPLLASIGRDLEERVKARARAAFEGFPVEPTVTAWRVDATGAKLSVQLASGDPRSTVLTCTDLRLKFDSAALLAARTPERLASLVQAADLDWSDCVITGDLRPYLRTLVGERLGDDSFELEAGELRAEGPVVRAPLKVTLRDSGIEVSGAVLWDLRSRDATLELDVGALAKGLGEAALRQLAAAVDAEVKRLLESTFDTWKSLGFDVKLHPIVRDGDRISTAVTVTHTKGPAVTVRNIACTARFKPLAVSLDLSGVRVDVTGAEGFVRALLEKQLPGLAAHLKLERVEACGSRLTAALLFSAGDLRVPFELAFDFATRKAGLELDARQIALASLAGAIDGWITREPREVVILDVPVRLTGCKYSTDPGRGSLSIAIACAARVRKEAPALEFPGVLEITYARAHGVEIKFRMDRDRSVLSTLQGMVASGLLSNIKLDALTGAPVTIKPTHLLFRREGRVPLADALGQTEPRRDIPTGVVFDVSVKLWGSATLTAFGIEISTQGVRPPTRLRLTYDRGVQIPPFLRAFALGAEIPLRDSTTIELHGSLTGIPELCEYLVRLNGTLEYDYKRPLRLETRTDLVLLTFFALQTERVVVDLEHGSFQRTLRTNPLIEKYISLSGDTLIEIGHGRLRGSGDLVLAILRKEIRRQRTEFVVDWRRRRLELDVLYRLPIAAVNLHVEVGGSSFVAQGEFSFRVGEFDIVGAKLRLEPSRAVLTFVVLDQDIVVAVETPEELTGGRILEEIAKRLGPKIDFPPKLPTRLPDVRVTTPPQVKVRIGLPRPVIGLPMIPPRIDLGKIDIDLFGGGDDGDDDDDDNGGGGGAPAGEGGPGTGTGGDGTTTTSPDGSTTTTSPDGSTTTTSPDGTTTSSTPDGTTTTTTPDGNTTTTSPDGTTTSTTPGGTTTRTSPDGTTTTTTPGGTTTTTTPAGSTTTSTATTTGGTPTAPDRAPGAEPPVDLDGADKVAEAALAANRPEAGWIAWVRRGAWAIGALGEPPSIAVWRSARVPGERSLVFHASGTEQRELVNTLLRLSSRKEDARRGAWPNALEERLLEQLCGPPARWPRTLRELPEGGFALVGRGVTWFVVGAHVPEGAPAPERWLPIELTIDHEVTDERLLATYARQLARTRPARGGHPLSAPSERGSPSLQERRADEVELARAREAAQQTPPALARPLESWAEEAGAWTVTLEVPGLPKQEVFRGLPRGQKDCIVLRPARGGRPQVALLRMDDGGVISQFAGPQADPTALLQLGGDARPGSTTLLGSVALELLSSGGLAPEGRGLRAALDAGALPGLELLAGEVEVPQASGTHETALAVDRLRRLVGRHGVLVCLDRLGQDRGDRAQGLLFLTKGRLDTKEPAVLALLVNGEGGPAWLEVAVPPDLVDRAADDLRSRAPGPVSSVLAAAVEAAVEHRACSVRPLRSGWLAVTSIDTGMVVRARLGWGAEARSWTLQVKQELGELLLEESPAGAAFAEGLLVTLGEMQNAPANGRLAVVGQWSTRTAAGPEAGLALLVTDPAVEDGWAIAGLGAVRLWPTKLLTEGDSALSARVARERLTGRLALHAEAIEKHPRRAVFGDDPRSLDAGGVQRVLTEAVGPASPPFELLEYLMDGVEDPRELR